MGEMNFDSYYLLLDNEDSPKNEGEKLSRLWWVVSQCGYSFPEMKWNAASETYAIAVGKKTISKGSYKEAIEGAATYFLLTDSYFREAFNAYRKFLGRD